jgi:hypothetical protein
MCYVQADSDDDVMEEVDDEPSEEEEEEEDWRSTKKKKKRAKRRVISSDEDDDAGEQQQSGRSRRMNQGSYKDERSSLGSGKTTTRLSGAKQKIQEKKRKRREARGAYSGPSLSDFSLRGKALAPHVPAFLNRIGQMFQSHRTGRRLARSQRYGCHYFCSKSRNLPLMQCVRRTNQSEVPYSERRYRRRGL